jgi:hypothetical protein
MVELPPAIADLEVRLFQNLIRDIQATLRIREDAAGGSGVALFVFLWLFWFDDWIRGVSENTVVINLCLPVSVVILLVVEYFWDKSFQDAVESEIPLRLNEWQPLFAKQGYRLEYVVDEAPHFWNLTETYLLIESTTNNQFAVDANEANDDKNNVGSSDEPRCDFVAAADHDEVCYLIYFARSFVRRNQSYRVLDLKPNYYYGQKYMIPKAPVLLDLNVQVFDKVMLGIKDCCTLYTVHAWAFFLIFFLSYWTAMLVIPEYALVLSLLIELVAFFLYYNVFPACGLYRLPESKLEEWNQFLQAHGFMLSYHDDKQTWWQWHESYLKIRRLTTNDSMPPAFGVSA